MTIFKKLRRGNITLLTAAISVLLVGVVALVTDVGYLYYDHARLQSATNAAWKAGYDKLAEIRKIKSRLTAEDEATIKNHMREVMAANGFDNLTDEQLKIVLTSNQTNLRIDSSDEVNLFFMKIFDIHKADVAAARAGGMDASAIMPIAIPHGEVHDLSWKTYDFIKFENGQGFATGTEYIIKLGEAEGNDPLGKEDYMIYIPTGLLESQPNGPNNDGTPTMLAYGAIYWALQIDERDKESLTPAYWFLSENGGGFLMRKGAAFEQKLKSGDYKGVTYREYYADQILNLLGAVGVTNVDKEHINDYLTGLARGEITNSRIIPLTWRPQIAIYSSQAALDPVETILVAAKIPYGNYALPKTTNNPYGWDRTSDYDSSFNTKIFDLEILNGELDKFDWIHLHHEDFTGLTVEDAAKYCYGAFPTTCQKIKPGCSANIAIGTEKYSSRGEQVALDYLKDMACNNCKEHMTYKSEQVTYQEGRRWVTKTKVTLTGWDISLDELNATCLNAITTRCQNCGVFDKDNLSNQTNFSGCKFYKYLNERYGYTDDTPFPYVFQESDISLSPYDLCMKWFEKATAYQKMKWDVAETIKQHILKGGFMYTQCFAAETIDLSLQQHAFHELKDLQQSYDNCMIFKDFTYLKLPSKGSATTQGYSSIFTNKFGVGTVQNAFKLSPLCQVTGAPNTGAGATCSFADTKVKVGIDKMSRLTNEAWQYVGGQLTNANGEKKGQFSLMGGHYAQNLDAKRFVLNNILFGSTSDKETSIGTHLTGRTKYQYGCIDPDNNGNRNSSDYSNRLLYGYDQPINFADIISSDNGKYSNETTNGLDIITGKLPLASYTPNQIVIVPIVGVPDSVQDYQSGLIKIGDQEIVTGDYTIYDLKVGAYNSGAEDYDNLNSNFSPNDVGLNNLKNSVQIIGFAKFRILAQSEYTRSDVLGDPLVGQIRGEFLGYIVDPREVETLLEAYNSGKM